MLYKTPTWLLGASLVLGMTAGAGASVGGWVESFGSGSGSSATCNTNETCISVTTGSGIGKIAFAGQSQNDQGNQGDDNGHGVSLAKYNFTASLTADSGTTTSNALGGVCSAAGGTVTITPAHGPASKDNLVLDVQGSACQVGNTATDVLTGSWVVDSASTGVFANAAGIGAISISTNLTNASNVPVDFSLSGNIHF